MRTWILLALLLPACDGPRREARAEERAHARAARTLGEAAELYWRAMRWEDHGAAAGFIEDAERRVAWMAEQQSRQRLHFRAAEVSRVEVGPPLAEHPLGHTREAQVLVQVQVWRVDEQILRTELRVQGWYQGARGWYVLPGEELGQPAAAP